MGSKLVFALLLIAAGTGPGTICHAGGSTAKLSEDCFDELENGKGSEIACEFPLRLTEQERQDLKRITRDYMHDLTCTMTVRIARAKVEEAIRATDLVFQSPEQPVKCTVNTGSSVFDVTGSFSPRVVFKGDKAVQGSPGLGNVTGVSRALWWPVALYVNYGPGMRSGLLQVVNAYRDHARKKHSQSAAKPQ